MPMLKLYVNKDLYERDNQIMTTSFTGNRNKFIRMKLSWRGFSINKFVKNVGNALPISLIYQARWYRMKREINLL